MNPRINHHPEICNRINRILFSGPTGQKSSKYSEWIQLYPLPTLLFGLIVPVEVSEVRAAIREILQYVLDHPEMATREVLDSYFEQVIWSIEKQEWLGLTEQEKQWFSDQVEDFILERGR